MSLSLYQYHNDPESLYGFDEYMHQFPDAAVDLARSRGYGGERLEDAIATSAQYSYEYAREVLDTRFPKGEDAIATDAGYSLSYTKYVLEKRFPKGEDAIATDARSSYWYARYVLFYEGLRIEKIEDSIATDARYSYEYAEYALKRKRFIKGEDAIATSAQYSYMYALYVLKARFPKGEPIIRGSEYQEYYEREFGIKL